MLRVGLTGELGSGKSTVARMLARHGAIVLSSDEMARAMMQPGHAAYDEIVNHFGARILNPDKTLNRSLLAKIAFDPDKPRIEELNAIIHPAVIAAQTHKIAELARTKPDVIVVVESALIFSTAHAPGRSWADRFDCIVIVTAPDQLKIDRFIQRTRPSPGEESAAREQARRRIEAQHAPVPEDLPSRIIENSGSIDALQFQIDTLWRQLVTLEERR